MWTWYIYYDIYCDFRYFLIEMILFHDSVLGTSNVAFSKVTKYSKQIQSIKY